MSTDPGFNTADPYFTDTPGYGVFAKSDDDTSETSQPDYYSWGWKQIEAAIDGGSVLATAAAVQSAESQVDYTTLWDAGDVFQYVMEVLRAVGENLLIEANLLAGYSDSPWQGDAASAFLADVTYYSQQVLANAEVLAGGSAGLYQNVPQQLVDSGNHLASAQAWVQAVENWYATQALKDGAATDSHGFVLISTAKGHADEIAQDMADDMRTYALMPLVGKYKITIAGVNSPPSTASLNNGSIGSNSSSSLTGLPVPLSDPNAPGGTVTGGTGVTTPVAGPTDPVTGLPVSVSALNAPASGVTGTAGPTDPVTGLPVSVSALNAPASGVTGTAGPTDPVTGLPVSVSALNAPALGVTGTAGPTDPVTGLPVSVSALNAPASGVTGTAGPTDPVTGLPVSVSALNAPASGVTGTAGVVDPVTGLPVSVSSPNAPVAGVSGTAAPVAGTNRVTVPAAAGKPAAIPLSSNVVSPRTAVAVNPIGASTPQGASQAASQVVDSAAPAAAGATSQAADGMPMMPMMGGAGANGGQPGLERSDASGLLGGETRPWSPDPAVTGGDEAGSLLGAAAGGLGLAGLGMMMGRGGAREGLPGLNRSDASGLLSDETQPWHGQDTRADVEPAYGTAADGPDPTGAGEVLPQYPAAHVAPAADVPDQPPSRQSVGLPGDRAARDGSTVPGQQHHLDDTSAWGPASAAAALLLSLPEDPSPARAGNGAELPAQAATWPDEVSDRDPAESSGHSDLTTWQRASAGSGPGSIVGASAEAPVLRCSSAPSPDGGQTAPSRTTGEDEDVDEDADEAAGSAADLLVQEAVLWGRTWHGDPGVL